MTSGASGHSGKRSAPYVAGPQCGWVKVKTQRWRQANRERYKMFEKDLTPSIACGKF